MVRWMRFSVFGLLLAASALGASVPAAATNNTSIASTRIGEEAGPLFMLLSIIGWLQHDPAITVQSTRHAPWTQSVNGTSSLLPATRTNTVTSLAYAGFDVSNYLGLARDQRLMVGGFYQSSWSSATAIGSSRMGSEDNGLGLYFSYDYSAWHLVGGFEYNWGDAHISSLAGGASRKVRQSRGWRARGARTGLHVVRRLFWSGSLAARPVGSHGATEFILYRPDNSHRLFGHDRRGLCRQRRRHIR